jgi:outer membrane protein
MKNGLLVFNIILLILIGILFYLHFSDKRPAGEAVVKTVADTSTHKTVIAYFEMDSITNSYGRVKEVRAELNAREQSINAELAGMEKQYRAKLSQYQAQGNTMTQVQSEAAQRDLMQMQQNLNQKKQQLDQDYQDYTMRKMQEVKNGVEDFLKKYNESKGNKYTYILSYEPGFIYYRDTMYNITADVLKGLNSQYKKK